jgi:hypothetical protein
MQSVNLGAKMSVDGLVEVIFGETRALCGGIELT